VLGPASGEIAGTQSKLKDLVSLLVANNNGVQNHHFFLAGSPTVEDVFLRTDNEWHTVLAFGRGRGGRFLTALDVSNAGDWDGGYSSLNPIPAGDPRLPRLLWNVGNLDGVGDGLYDGLGETWSVPVMGPVKTASSDQWLMFAGAGYGCSGTDQGEYLYALQIEDGSVYARFRVPNDDPSAPIDHNQLVATPTLYNPHEKGVADNQDFVTRVYIGDLQGNVYKLDTYADDPASWTFNTFYSFGVNQPITAPAAVVKMGGGQQVLVFVGTGGDQRVSSAAAGRFKIAGLADNDPEGANNPGVLVQDANGNPFLVDLPQGERTFVAPVTALTADGKGAVFFASTASSFNTQSCTSQFSSTLFAFEASTGLAAFDVDPSAAGTQSSASLGQGKVTGLFHRDEHLYISRSGAIGVTAETEVRGSASFPKPDTAATATVRVMSEGFRWSPF
jgi:Tfp pilus tip-associated adhesin PilY1